MSVSARFHDALHEIIDEGCPVVRDPDTARRCGRRRYARRRCFACAEMPAKPLALVAAHATEYGGSLSGAFLVKARLAGGEFRWGNFRYARLSGADLRGADLRGADFSGADISTADFRGADLTHARFRRLRNLAGARFDGALLEAAVLTTAASSAPHGGPACGAEAPSVRRRPDLPDVSFARADLTGANLSNAALPGASFRGARVAGADFRGAVLVGADFTDADLADADLAGADVTGASFEGARLENVRLAVGRSVEDLQERAHEPGTDAAVLAECMRAFAGVRASSDRTRLRVLARKTPGMRREDSLDLVLPILEKEDVPETCAEEAVAALRALGRDPSTRPFLVGLLSRGAEKVRLEAAAILAEAPLDGETRRLFHSILTARSSGSEEGRNEQAHGSFRRGVFRALAPGVEDGDAESVRLARDLLEAGELFDGELIAALGQSGVDDKGYRRAIETIAFDGAQSEAARLAAARELAERFFDAGTCARLGELIESAESAAFRRNAFWFVARRVTDGEEPAVELARRLLPVDRALEPDIRWALAEGGDSGQAGYFMEVVGRGVREGWRGGGQGDDRPPRYDSLVRAAQVLGRIGTAEAVEPLAELVRRDQAASAPPQGSPFSLTEAAREAIISIRSALRLAPAQEETSIGEMPVGEETRIGPAAAVRQAHDGRVLSPSKGAAEEAPCLPPDDVLGHQAAAEEVATVPGKESDMAGEDRREEEEREPEAEGREEEAPREAAEEAPAEAGAEAPEEARPEEVAAAEAPEAPQEEAEAESARLAAEEEARRAEEEAREAEEAARRAEEERLAREAEEVRQAGEARQAEETARRAEEERRAREAEEARLVEEARQAEEAARRAEEERRAREAEEARAAEELVAAPVGAAEPVEPVKKKVPKKPAKKAAKKKKAKRKKAPKKKATKKKKAKKKRKKS